MTTLPQILRLIHSAIQELSYSRWDVVREKLNELRSLIDAMATDDKPSPIEQPTQAKGEADSCERILREHWGNLLAIVREAYRSGVAAMKEPQSSMITCGECGQPFDTYGDGGRKCPKCCGKQSQPAKSEAVTEESHAIETILHDTWSCRPMTTTDVRCGLVRALNFGRELERAELRRNANDGSGLDDLPRDSRGQGTRGTTLEGTHG